MKPYPFLAITFAASVALGGCKAERRTIYQIDLGVAVSDRAHIDHVVLYIYDTEDRLLSSQQGGRSTWFDIAQYQSNGKLGIVAWANTLNGGVKLESEGPLSLRSSSGEMLEDSAASFAGHQLSRTPPDLFFGARDVAFVEQYDDPSIGNNRYIIGKIPLRRIVASYAITVRNARSTFGEPAKDLTLLVRNPYSGIDFSGVSTGRASYTVPRTTYDAVTDELRTAFNYALPTGDSSIVVEIYRADELLFSTASPTNTSRLKFTADTFHNIIIDKQNQSTINIIPAHWGDQSLDEIFN